MIAPATSKPSPISHTLDDAQRRTICALVARGSSVKQAARYAGCALRTVRHERDTNDRFRLKLAQAKVKHELAPLRALQRAMKKDWRALAWYLERTQPEKFGRRNHRAFTQKQANALVKDLTNIIGEEVASKSLYDKLQTRVEAAVRYACHAHNDMNRTAAELGRAMKHRNMKSPLFSPTLESVPAGLMNPRHTGGAHSGPSTPNTARPNSAPPSKPNASSNLPPRAVASTPTHASPKPSSPPTPTGRTIAQMIVDTVDKQLTNKQNSAPPPPNTASPPLASSASSNLPPKTSP